MRLFSKFLRLVRRSSNAVGVEYTSVSFVPKNIPNDETPWVRFGSTKEEYEKWIPEVCGICCLKMVGDTFGITTQLSLYELTIRCLEKGGFKISKDGFIAGVFHYPLIELAQELGLKGSVERNLTILHIRQYLSMNRLIILSVDLQKGTSFKGNHLILIHRYLEQDKVFLIHDCAFAVGKEGENIPISEEQLTALSNQRGMTLWK